MPQKLDWTKPRMVDVLKGPMKQTIGRSKMAPAIPFLAMEGSKNDPAARHARNIVQGNRGTPEWMDSVNWFAQQDQRDLLKNIDKRYDDYRRKMPFYRRMKSQLPSVQQANMAIGSNWLNKLKGMGRENAGPGFAAPAQAASAQWEKQRNLARMARRDWKTTQKVTGDQQYRGILDMLNQFFRGKDIDLKDILQGILGANPNSQPF